jgi:type IV fimbrial biogenesis protein FimT
MLSNNRNAADGETGLLPLAERANMPSEMHTDKRRIKGLTLIEMMVALAIIGLLSVIGVGSFTELLTSNRISTQANDFFAAVSVARSEAVRRGAPVCMKKVSATSKEWTKGWTIFVDGNAARTVTDMSKFCATQGLVLQNYASLSGGNTLTAGDDNFDDGMRFNGMGVPVDKDDVGKSSTFLLCRKDKNAAKSKLLSVSTTGLTSVSSSTPTC